MELFYTMLLIQKISVYEELFQILSKVIFIILFQKQRNRLCFRCVICTINLSFSPFGIFPYKDPIYMYLFRAYKQNQKIEEKSPQLPAEPEKQHQEFKQQIIKALEGSNIYSKKKHWEKEEDGLLRNLHQKENMNWKQISQQIPDTNQRICQRRYRRILENEKNWLPQEEEKIKYLRQVENKKWKQISQAVPSHSSKQIRERYINFLRSDIINKGWQLEEDLKIISSLCENGKKWKRLEKQLEGRSENQIKNRYYGTLIFIEKKVKKKMRKEKNKKNKVSTKEEFS